MIPPGTESNIPLGQSSRAAFYEESPTAGSHHGACPASFPQDQMTVTEFVPRVFVYHRFPVRLYDAWQSDERSEHRQVTGDWVVESRQEPVDRSDGVPGMDKDPGESLPSADPI